MEPDHYQADDMLALLFTTSCAEKPICLLACQPLLARRPLLRKGDRWNHGECVLGMVVVHGRPQDFEIPAGAAGVFTVLDILPMRLPLGFGQQPTAVEIAEPVDHRVRSFGRAVDGLFSLDVDYQHVRNGHLSGTNAALRLVLAGDVLCKFFLRSANICFSALCEETPTLSLMNHVPVSGLSRSRAGLRFCGISQSSREPVTGDEVFVGNLNDLQIAFGSFSSKRGLRQVKEQLGGFRERYRIVVANFHRHGSAAQGRARILFLLWRDWSL